MLVNNDPLICIFTIFLGTTWTAPRPKAYTDSLRVPLDQTPAETETGAAMVEANAPMPIPWATPSAPAPCPIAGRPANPTQTVPTMACAVLMDVPTLVSMAKVTIFLSKWFMSDLIRHYSSIFGSFWLILYLLGSFFSMSNDFFVDGEGITIFLSKCSSEYWSMTYSNPPLYSVFVHIWLISPFWGFFF